MTPTWPTVAATGHRPQHLDPGQRAWVRAELRRVVLKLRDQHGLQVGISGMAIGTDLWWADELVRADVALWAHVPFPQQWEPWLPVQRDEWHRLHDLAAKVTTYGDRYDVRLLHARNDGMLAAANAVVAVHKAGKTTGGTASAVQKARQRGLPVVNIDPERRTVTGPARRAA